MVIGQGGNANSHMCAITHSHAHTKLQSSGNASNFSFENKTKFLKLIKEQIYNGKKNRISNIFTMEIWKLCR